MNVKSEYSWYEDEIKSRGWVSYGIAGSRGSSMCTYRARSAKYESRSLLFEVGCSAGYAYMLTG